MYFGGLGLTTLLKAQDKDILGLKQVIGAKVLGKPTLLLAF